MFCLHGVYPVEVGESKFHTCVGAKRGEGEGSRQPRGARFGAAVHQGSSLDLIEITRGRRCVEFFPKKSIDSD